MAKAVRIYMGLGIIDIKEILIDSMLVTLMARKIYTQQHIHV